MIDKEIFEIGGPAIIEVLSTDEPFTESIDSRSTSGILTSVRSQNDSQVLPGNCKDIQLAKTDWLPKPSAKRHSVSV